MNSHEPSQGERGEHKSEASACNFASPHGKQRDEIVDGRDAEALIKVIEEPIGDIAVLKLEPAGSGKSSGEFPVTPGECAKAGLKLCARETDISYFLWAFRQRFSVDFGDKVVILPESDLSEEQTVEEIMELFEAGIQDTLNRIRFYSGAYR